MLPLRIPRLQRGASPRRLTLAIGAAAIAVASYQAAWESDVYVSESKFTVRAAASPGRSPVASALLPPGLVRNSEDANVVREYVQSRDAVRTLSERAGLRQAFTRPEADRLSRFAGLDPDDSFEALYRYYLGKVKVVTDTASGVTTLTVRAFSAKDAQSINNVLLEESEALVNRLSDRSRLDLLRHAHQDVREAEHRAADAALRLAGYRKSQGLLNPEAQAMGQLQHLSKLQEERVQVQLQLSQLRRVAPQSPQALALQQRADDLAATIDKESGKVAGAQKSLAAQAPDYQRLQLELDFANRQMASSLASLESARSEAQRQHVYLERVASPSLPDSAQEPRRLRAVAATAALALATWAVLAMVIAGIREHQDWKEGA